jgi:hypothetical protein
MHPVMTEMLAAERIREMVARGDAARCVRQARPGRRDRRDRQGRQGRQGRQAELRAGLEPATRAAIQPIVPRPRESQENQGRTSVPGRPSSGQQAGGGTADATRDAGKG